MILTQNETAFLAMVSHSEGTDRATDPYRVCFTFRHTIVDQSNHPAITGEWKGEPLDFLGPKYTGLISTAAGRYQITKHTWEALQGALNLPDFTGPSQDAAAILLIKQKGALDLVNAGDVQSAVQRCSTVWASLPYSDAGQPTKSLSALVQIYQAAGGKMVA